MAGRRPIAVRPVPSVQIPAVEDAKTQRALDVLSGSLSSLQGRRQRDVIETNLVVGTNRISHGLGRACVGYTLTMSAIDLTFGHAIDRTNPRPDREIWITVVGNDQNNITLEVY